MDGIDDRLDAASRPTAERWLGALGLDEADARVLLATPVLRRSWWLAVILALLLAVLAAQEAPDGSTALLVLAPLLPMAATAAAFAPRLDPAWQLTAATPFPQLRLLLLRTGAVAGGSTILAVAAGLFLPVGPGAAIRWLVPAAALAAAVLALATWLEPGTAAGICGVVWLTLVAVVSHGGSTALELYDLPAQAASVAVLAAACSVIYRQRHHLRSGSPA